MPIGSVLVGRYVPHGHVPWVGLVDTLGSPTLVLARRVGSGIPLLRGCALVFHEPCGHDILDTCARRAPLVQSQGPVTLWLRLGTQAWLVLAAMPLGVGFLELSFPRSSTSTLGVRAAYGTPNLFVLVVPSAQEIGEGDQQ